MRKIEIQMLNAIYNNKAWQLGNTTVTPRFDGSLSVYLHGNHIADVVNSQIADGVITPRIVDVNKETLRQWSTPTTKSRLRALGADVSTRKGITYLNDVAI
jgi:hypothetical protein